MTDERANARAAALVILETLPAWGRLTAAQRADILKRHVDAILEVKRRYRDLRERNGPTWPSIGNSGVF